MSFNTDVKEELAAAAASSRHCQIAELASVLWFAGSICYRAEDRLEICIRTENYLVAKKAAGLIWKLFRIPYEVRIRVGSGSGRSLYMLAVTDSKEAMKILQAADYLDADGIFHEELSLKKNRTLKKECCRRSFLRGAFLTAGAMSSPEKSYHLDFICGSKERAVQMTELLESVGIHVRTSCRKTQWIVYLAGSEEIAELLGMMGASGAMMEMENQIILKEMRNRVNRKVNCDTANINKTVAASVRQIEAIRYLDVTVGIRNLPLHLAEMARLRVEYPEASLTELGELADPPVGKSGVNHRLRKLCELAEKKGMLQ